MADRRLYAQFTLDVSESHKIAPLSDTAFRAWFDMVLWSRRNLSDGRIPASMALVLARRKQKVLTELTTNDPSRPSLVMDEHGDYWLHDFLEHQPSKVQVETKQQTNRANGAKGGQAKAKRGATESVSESVADLVAEPVADSYTETEGAKTPLPPEGGRAGAGATPPSPFCSIHPTGTTDPCRACGDARRAHAAWIPPAVVKPSAWRPGLCRDHLQAEDDCDMCTYENAHAHRVLVGVFGGAA